MKKYISILLMLTLTGVLSGCGGSPPTQRVPMDTSLDPPSSKVILNSAPEVSGAESAKSKDKDSIDSIDTTKTLVVYFSHSGNTKMIAEYIVEQVGGDIFEIKTVDPYPSDYDRVVDQAKKEQSDNTRPELSAAVENLADYDRVFIGYPNWWGDMPMAVYSFLDTYNLSGKTILPFCTHGGSGLSDTVASIQSEEAEATVASGLAIRDSSLSDAKPDVVEWLKSAGVLN